jgi:hypothetical protein
MPKIKEISIHADQSWEPDETTTVWKSKPKKLAQKVFFIGWLPVLIRAEGSLRVEATWSGASVGLLINLI